MPLRKGLRDGVFGEFPESEVDYVLDDNTSLLSLGSNLIPLGNAVATPRIFYGGRFFSQADPLVYGEAPLVQAQKGDSSFDAYAGRFAGAIWNDDEDEESEVVDVTDNSIKLKSASGKKREIPLFRNFSLNRKNRYHQTPLVEKGQRVQPGQILARSNFTDTEGNLAMGVNARIAVVPYKGYSTDDATVISRSFAERLKSDHLLDFIADPEEGIRWGKDSFQAIHPKVFSQEQLDKLDEEGVVRPGTILEPGDPIFLRTGTPEARLGERLTGAMARHLKNRRTDKSEIWDDLVPGKVEDVVRRRDGGYHVTVHTERPAREGDKIVGRSGNKFTISRILDDEQMLRNEDGEPFEMLANPQGLPSRVNNSFTYELALGKMARKLEQPRVAVPLFNAPEERWNRVVMDMLEGAEVPLRERVYDPESGEFLAQPVVTGPAYILKLHHQAQGKLSARAQGGYTQWQQPRKGGDEGGGSQRQSGLETYGLLSAGAYGLLRDGLTVRGQQNDEYWRAIRENRTPPVPGVPFAWDKMRAMLHGAGYNTREVEDRVYRLGPATDRDLEAVGAQELLSGELIDINSGRGIEGGLFDESDAVTDKWRKITLPFPVPNPAFTRAVASLLDIKPSEMEPLLQGDLEIRGETGPEGMKKLLAGLDKETLREEARQIIRDGAKTKRGAAVRRLNVLQGLDRNELEPVDMMIQAVPVIPAKFRPYGFAGETLLTGDVNKLYRDLFLIKNSTEEHIEEFGETPESKSAIWNAVKALYGTGQSDTKKLQEQGVRGFLEQVLGSGGPKYSIFQRNLFAKTVDFAGRGVAGVESDLGLDEVGLPWEEGWTLFAPWIQQRLVRSGLTPAEAIEHVKNRTERAKSALIAESEERPVVINRAPAWHKFNSLGMFAKFHDGSNIKVNTLANKGQNTDFDGDQFGVFVPASDYAVQDVLERLMPSRQIFSIRDPYKLVNPPQQDIIVGLYKAATRPSEKTHRFRSMEEAKLALKAKQIGLSDRIIIEEDAN